MTTSQLIPAIVIPLIAWRVYARVRKNIGRQALRPGRLQVSIALFVIITVLFGLSSLRYLPALGALIGGLGLAVGLGFYGLQLTKFETTPEGKFYTPNTALGLAISALFLGRVAYRFITLYAAPSLHASTSPEAWQSPLTYFLFGLSAGYFITYQIGVLMKSRLR